jgi:hypothetical protein
VERRFDILAEVLIQRTLGRPVVRISQRLLYSALLAAVRRIPQRGSYSRVGGTQLDDLAEVLFQRTLGRPFVRISHKCSYIALWGVEL